MKPPLPSFERGRRDFMRKLIQADVMHGDVYLYDVLMAMPDNQRDTIIRNGIILCEKLPNCGPAGALMILLEIGRLMVENVKEIE